MLQILKDGFYCIDLANLHDIGVAVHGMQQFFERLGKLVCPARIVFIIVVKILFQCERAAVLDEGIGSGDEL